MSSYLRHIALVVPNLQEAEEYYISLFHMELLGRETDLDDGQWYTLPTDKSWQDAETAGIEIKMLALRKDKIVLAFFPGTNPSGQVFAIGLTMDEADIVAVRAGLPSDSRILLDTGKRLHFIDRYGIMWQLELPGVEFMMHGDAHGRWIEL